MKFLQYAKRIVLEGDVPPHPHLLHNMTSEQLHKILMEEDIDQKVLNKVINLMGRNTKLKIFHLPMILWKSELLLIHCTNFNVEFVKLDVNTVNYIFHVDDWFLPIFLLKIIVGKKCLQR